MTTGAMNVEDFYSFDIFDTCLVRLCGCPINMFDILSMYAFKTVVSQREREEFAYYRLNAQKELANNPAATLYDIYSNLEYSNPSLKSKEDLIKAELDCERALLMPNLEILDKIEKLHKKGINVHFISDMYLPSIFLKEILTNLNFFKEGDGIYVSCEYGATKEKGELFNIIRQREPVIHTWYHIGDNEIGDFEVARNLGIRADKYTLNYSPYAEKWRKTDISVHAKIKSLVAGVSRAIQASEVHTSHTAFVTDVVAPFNTILTYRILREAAKDGIKRLYFCARDAYQIYNVAKQISHIFPSVESRYLYISRQAMKSKDDEAKISYYQQIGLAVKGEKVAIVDIRSTGWTLAYLNDMLATQGFDRIKGYYFEMFSSVSGIQYQNDYYTEINKAFITQNKNLGIFTQHSLTWSVYETYFAMNDTPKTIGYKMVDSKATPVFLEEEEVANDHNYQKNSKYWESEHFRIQRKFTDAFLKMKLYEYADVIFNHISLPTLVEFFERPQKEYTTALESFLCYNEKKGMYLPYVASLSFWQIFVRKNRMFIWREGTIANSMPKYILRLRDFMKSYHRK